MLNPTQLKLHNFQLLENGCYSPREVDNFFRQVTEDYSSMFSENGELVRKLGILAAKLEEYRKDESVLRDVLMNAQKNAELLIASAQQRANEMIEDANAQVQRIMKDGETIIDSANDKAHKINIAAEAEYESLIASAKVLAESYIVTANEKCAEIKAETETAVEQMLKDVEEQAVVVLEDAQDQAQIIRDEAAETVEEYINELRESARAEIEAKAQAAEKLFVESQTEADRITSQAAEEADLLLASVKEQTESLLAAALAQKEAIEITSAAEAEELLAKANHVAEDATKQYDALIQEATEQSQAILDDGRNKAVTMLTEAQMVSKDAKLRTETSSQQIIARIKDQALKMLTEAKTYSDEVCEKVLTQAEQVISAAKIEADRILNDAKDYAENTKKEITELSDARMTQAMDMSGNLISSAQADAQRIIATAQTRVSVAFDDVEGRVEQTLLDAEKMRVEMLEAAKTQAEETTKLADENAQRMMDEAIEKAAGMLIGAKQENDRISALTVDMKQQLADSIAFAQAEYDALREKAMELRKKMLAQLLTEEEQATETAKRPIRDIPEFDAQEMLREGMKRAKESASEIVTDSKEMLLQSGLYEERTLTPEPIAEVTAQSVPAMVEEIQRRIDIDDDFESLISEPEEMQDLTAVDMTADIENKILHNAALDVNAVVDEIIGDDGFATINDITIDADIQDITEFDDLPDFDSMISSYKAVKLDSISDEINSSVPAVQIQDAVASETDDTEQTEDVYDESEFMEETDEIVNNITNDIQEAFLDESFESFDKPAVSSDVEQTEEYAVPAETETIAENEENAEVVDAVVENKPAVAESDDEELLFADDDWEDFGDFTAVSDEDLNDWQEEIPVFEQVVDSDVGEEFIVPIHEDYVQEDAVFTDYDDSQRSFEDASDVPAEETETIAEDLFDSGFEIDFSVFEDSPKKRNEEVPVVQERTEKGSFFRRNKKK